MKLWSKFCALGAVLVLTTAFASADSVTLVSNSGTVTGDTTVPAFAVVYPGLTNFALASTTTVNLASNGTVWALPVPGSSWVSYAQTGPMSSPFVSTPNGNYFFQTTFSLTTPTMDSGSIDVYADDTVTVFLNGHQINTPNPTPSGNLGLYPHCLDGSPNCLGVATLITLPTGDFISGQNVLTFEVTQGNDEDFGVDFAGSIATTPEPSTLILLGTGLLGSAGALFRRRRS